MIFLRAVEMVIVVVVGYLSATQVIIPLWVGTPLFPLFRRTGALHRELRNVQGEVVNLDTELQIEDYKSKIKKVRDSQR